MTVIDSNGPIANRFGTETAPKASGPDQIPMHEWLEATERKDATSKVAIVVPSDANVLALQDHLDNVGAIFLHFDRFADGRPYSQARLLRSRLGFKGEIRACGDVLADQVLALRRCGVDTFQLRSDQDWRECIAALQAFTARYQPDAPLSDAG